jgi:glucosylceramidase
MTIQTIVETAKDTDRRIAKLAVDERTPGGARNLSCIITLDQSKTFQTFSGFGCALTESSGYVLSRLPSPVRQNVIESCFLPDPERSNCYVQARTHMNSCDFSLDNWACLPSPDKTLRSFSMERTDMYLTPLLQEASFASGGTLKLLISPWSPPAWMKSNADMNNGGFLQPEYRELWADYFVRFITELKKRGLSVSLVSIQNEPAAVQTWDSCIWSGAEEGSFAASCLGPALKKAGYGDIRILVWDHNRDLLFSRMSESMHAAEELNGGGYIGGAAYHWYSGDQYENVAKTAEKWPDKLLVFSEGCIEAGTRPGAWYTGERYAHNIINDLNSGCNMWIDWNMVLDMQGGPNHVGNYCDAPVIADEKSGTVQYESSYWYIGHFSRFIKPGAVRIACTMQPLMTPATVDGRMGNTMESTAFRNPDGSTALVVSNRTEADMVYELAADTNADAAGEKRYTAKADDSGRGTILYCPPRSIQTVIIRP